MAYIWQKANEQSIGSQSHLFPFGALFLHGTFSFKYTAGIYCQSADHTDLNSLGKNKAKQTMRMHKENGWFVNKIFTQKPQVNAKNRKINV